MPKHSATRTWPGTFVYVRDVRRLHDGPVDTRRITAPLYTCITKVTLRNDPRDRR